jgi:two-component system, OmpR family, phosphate regulon sensor histidine kinase PhoR
MNSSLRILIAVVAAAMGLSLWITPWAGVAILFVALLFASYVAIRQRSAIDDLVREPESDKLPFSQLMSSLRTRLKDGEQFIRDRDAEIAQRRQITNAVPDGMFLLDRDDRIVWCNQAALVMHSLDAFRDIGKPIGQLIRSPDFLAYLKTPTELQPVIHVGQRSLLVRIENAVEGSRLLLTQDVTERDRLDRMRRDFIANVSHEMRTPLTVVGGYVETLLDLPLDPEDRQRYLTLISTQTDNMRRLVEDLLILARLENDQVPLEHASVPLHQIAREAVDDARALSNSRHHVDADIDDLTLKGSANELRSAIANLLSNAVRYTPEGGAVTLQLSRSDEAAILEVCDTGPGIAAEHIPRLTERFYRVDRSRSRETGGTGLGLAIVKHVAQRHGGALEIESVVGQGSTFRLRFPMPADEHRSNGL